MKFIMQVLMVAGLALGGLHLTSCQAFTKDDARALGGQIAKSSLEVAVRIIAGEKIDLKQAVALIGLQAASGAIATVDANLKAQANATPQSVVSAAHEVAQNAIEAAAVPDPEIATKAAEIATAAVAAAQTRLGAEGAASGK